MRSEVEEHGDFKRSSNEWYKVFRMILDDIKQLQPNTPLITSQKQHINNKAITDSRLHNTHPQHNLKM